MSPILKCVLLAVCTGAAAQGQEASKDPKSETSGSPVLHFTGDARYRYEDIHGLASHYDRQRVRARIGVEAEVTPTSRAVFKLSTGSGDPRSAHITFSGGYSRKDVGVDLAYLKWNPDAAFAASAGKIPYPTWRPAQSPFIGGDFNPEGFALNYGTESGIFASGYTFWLDDHGTDRDVKHNGTQLGYAFRDRSNEWTVAVSYSDLSHAKGAMPFLDGVSAFGNSVNPDGSLASGFRIIDTSAQWIHEAHAATVALFVHAAHNTRALRGADAYAGGVELAPKLLSHDIRLIYQYARIGQDSLFGQFMDGDFGGGVTDSHGHVVRVSSRPAPRTRATLSYFDNEVGQADQRHDFQLIQLDVDFLF